jgi:hypothetical protein
MQAGSGGLWGGADEAQCWAALRCYCTYPYSLQPTAYSTRNCAIVSVVSDDYYYYSIIILPTTVIIETLPWFSSVQQYY